MCNPAGLCRTNQRMVLRDGDVPFVQFQGSGECILRLGCLIKGDLKNEDLNSYIGMNRIHKCFLIDRQGLFVSSVECVVFRYTCQDKEISLIVIVGNGWIFKCMLHSYVAF